MGKKKEATFTKQQLAASVRYRDQRDLVAALLEDGRAYSLGEVDALLEKYKKGQVE